MRPAFLHLTILSLSLAACPSDPLIEATSENSSTGDASTSSTTQTPTEASATQMTTMEESTGTTAVSTTGGTTTTGGPDPTTDTGESTGTPPDIVVEGLAAPESILHDTVDDVYLISNINGEPDAVDDNGFISRVLPDGSLDPQNWIDGADDAVTLDAPKGLAILDDVLYVADITVVRKFDRVTGESIGEVVIPGAAFLNDLTSSPLGFVYVSDTMTNAIHVIADDDSVSELLTSPDLAGANGLMYAGDRVMAVGFNGPDLFQVLFESPAALVVHTFEFGQLDGIVAVADGTLVSSWEAMGVFLLSNDLMTVTPVVVGLGSPADIEVDLGRNVLLVPLLLEDRAVFYNL
jgi:hypothetical protein